MFVSSCTTTPKRCLGRELAVFSCLPVEMPVGSCSDLPRSFSLRMESVLVPTMSMY